MKAPTTPATIKTALTSLLNITHPIISAPMCGFAGGKMSGAVAAVGGCGLIGVGTSLIIPPERVIQEWEIAQKEISSYGNSHGDVKGSLGVGFLEGFMKDNDPSFEACLRLNPDVFFLGGFVTDEKQHPNLIQRIRSECPSSKIIVQTFTVQEAVDAAKLGADAVVLQGSDAGGHGRQGDTGASIVSLIPQARLAIQAACDKPCVLVAAGGIATGQQMAAALMLGADGVHLGSAFVVAEESLAANAFKQRIFDTADGTSGTVPSTVWDKLHRFGSPFVKGKFSGRALKDSEALSRFHGLEDKDFGVDVTEDDRDWYAKSDYNTKGVWTSTSTGLLNGPPIKAGDLVRKLTEEAIVSMNSPVHFQINQ